MPQATYQTVRLSRGKHHSPDDGVCVMELASMLAGGPFSDRPQGVCPVIGAFLRSYNDLVDDDGRQDLYAAAAAVIGTRSSRHVEHLRLDRCAEMLDRLECERSRLRRMLRRTTPVPAPFATVTLERFGVRLARAFQRSRGDGHMRALAFLDELIAIGTPAPQPPPAAAGRREAQPSAA